MIAAIRAHGDLSESYTGNQFRQFGAGFDLFHKSGIDIHGNWYFGDRTNRAVKNFAQANRFTRTTTQTVNAGTQSRVFSSGSGTPSRTVSFGAPTASGNSIVQNIVTRIFRGRQQFRQVNTFQRTNTITQTFKATGLEIGAEGGDLRVEVPVAADVIGLPQIGELDLMVGGYYYEMPFSGELSGAMAGLEWKPVENFGFGVTWYEDEEIFGGGNWVGSVFGRIPMEPGMISRHGGLAGAIAAGFKPRERPALRHRFLHETSPRRNRVMTQVGNDSRPGSLQLVSTKTVQGPKRLVSSRTNPIGGGQRQRCFYKNQTESRGERRNICEQRRSNRQRYRSRISQRNRNSRRPSGYHPGRSHEIGTESWRCWDGLCAGR